MSRSVFTILTKGKPKEREAMLNSLLNVEGVKEVHLFKKAVTLKIVRDVDFSVTIGAEKPSAVYRLVKMSVNDWSASRSDKEAEEVVVRVFAHLECGKLIGKSDRRQRYIVVEILPSMPTKFINSISIRPSELYVNVGSGKAVVLEKIWGQKERTTTVGISTITILNKYVDVEDLCHLLDWLIYKPFSQIRSYKMQEVGTKSEVTSRRPGIYIPVDMNLTFRVERDDKDHGGYTICTSDGSVIYKYSSHRVFSALNYVINYLQDKKTIRKCSIPIDQLAVHPFNLRYIPVEGIYHLRFSQLIRWAETGQPINPLIVTPVDPEVVSIIRVISDIARKLGLNVEDILAGMMWRKVRLEGDWLVAREDDEVYSATLRYCGKNKDARKPDGKIRYLIVDGYLRYVATCIAALKNVNSWKVIPEVDAVVLGVGTDGVFGLDVLSAAYLSKMVNAFDKNVATDVEAITAFVKLFRVGDALLELGDVMGLTSLIKVGEEMKGLENLEIPRISPTKIKYHIGPIEIKQEDLIDEEEEELIQKPEEMKRKGRRRLLKDQWIKPRSRPKILYRWHCSGDRYSNSNSRF
jgi:hypothetical protein